jgi:hypothetical protein
VSNKFLIMGGVFAVLLSGYYMTKSKPLGIRNNNPLNMREVGINWNNKTGENQGFTTFAQPFDGIRAAANDMKNKMRSGIDTIAKLVSVWAPPIENNTAAYIASVASRTGLEPDTLLFDVGELSKVVEAMIYHENGQQPFSKKLIGAAVFDGVTSGAPVPYHFDVIDRGEYV